ncbi:MAG TPA: beta-ketoacyl synthase chain length factor [Acidocella sp.]|nr:beta-ketoacyl synthase chain length factor [Acidocella sp.]HQU03323.1 beta-ketoacyl synthase chain length factor [Acidocella sp.]
MRLYVEAVGLCGPGLNGWAEAAAILAGQAAYVPAPVTIPASALLPANERRRAPKTVKLALAVGVEACAAAGRDPAETPAIFSSSGADGDTIHDILTVLASTQRELSPTKFHNSVHNAAAGYWSIATGAKAASTSLCSYDGSFAAGLLEAAAQLGAGGQAVLLIAYDVPYPSPLFAVRPVGAECGVALVLSPAPSAASFARLDAALWPGAYVGSSAGAALEPLRQNTPTARALPLLAALAGDGTPEVMLDYLPDMGLKVRITHRPAAGWPETLA